MSGKVFFARYERELKEPFRYGTQELRFRTGFLLSRAAPGDGLVAEASPLTSHSPDSIAQVEAALLGQAPSTASVAFALSCLSEEEISGSHEVQTNCLLGMSSPLETERALASYISQGFTHCKLKITPDNIGYLPRIMKLFPHARYRLDANLSLDAELLRRLLRDLEASSLLQAVDYVEEPFAGFWNSPFDGPKISYAADESAALSLLNTPNPPAVFVLKPATLGSLDAISTFISTVRRHGARAVVTTNLEAEPGRRAILRYLSQTNHEVAGLAIGFLFRDNFLPDRPLWPKIPDPSKAELSWIRSLHWREAKL